MVADRGTDRPMADDADNDDVASAPPEGAATQDGSLGGAPGAPMEKRGGEDRPSAERGERRMSGPMRRAIVLSAMFLVPCAVIALSIFSIVRDTARRGTTALTTRNVEPRPVDVSPPADAAGMASAAPLAKTEVASPVFYEETDDGEPAAAKPSPPKHYATVQQAASESCSTATVDGLSRQIIEQARCIKPNALVPLPPRSNVVLASHVFPYFEQEVRNHLLRALEANASKKMTINSALRTVAQQYLVWRWGAAKSCGVQLAMRPGESNHEIGIALDVAEAGQWRSALEAQEFRWLGASDRVHFDYRRDDGSPHSAMDVLAFQTLWNRNHTKDTIVADGHYSPATEQRLKKAPPNGFPIGPTCGKSGGRKR